MRAVGYNGRQRDLLGGAPPFAGRHCSYRRVLPQREVYTDIERLLVTLRATVKSRKNDRAGTRAISHADDAPSSLERRT